MFIMTNQYDAGRIYEVVNYNDCPLKSGAGAIVCAGYTADGTCIGAYSVEVRRAKNLPRDWRHVQPGLSGGGQCVWDKSHEVFVVENEYDDDDEWRY